MSARPVLAAVAPVRIAYGVALLVAPRAVLGGLAHGRADAPARLFARLLGARQLVEVAVLVRHGRRRPWLLAGAAVDAVHAATVAGLAIASPEHRRLALFNLAVASGFATAGVCGAAGR